MSFIDLGSLASLESLWAADLSFCYWPLDCRSFYIITKHLALSLIDLTSLDSPQDCVINSRVVARWQGRVGGEISY